MPSPWQPGQLLCAGFEGTEVPADLADLLGQGRIGTVILFARNVDSPRQLRELVSALHGHAPAEAPLLVAIDQEGGRVQRLRKPWTEWPPMRQVAELGDPNLTASIARAIARELVDMGIGLDFAPVVDVDTNPNNPVIGDRSFSRDPDDVSRHAAAFIRAMQDADVAACAKHFPGHGDTTTDSHLELPNLDHDIERLRRIELVPFRAAVGAGVASIMTAHVRYRPLDGKRPATLSPDIMAILRHELSYEGVVFSDDLEMRAVLDHFSPREMVAGCLEAGIDSVLVCKDRSLRTEVLGLLERAPDSAVERAVERVVELKQRFAGQASPGDLAGPPYPDHEELARRVFGPRA